MNKKTIFSAAFILTVTCLTTKAQSDAEKAVYMRDGYTWCTNDYYGTARTMGMGNAVTALGGDIGSIQFNPAGGAIAPYTQVSVSPGVSIATNNSHGLTASDGNTYLGDYVGNSSGRFIFPNGGFSIDFELGNIVGLKRVSLALVANTTNDYNDYVKASGISRSSTYAGYLADRAQSGQMDDVLDLALRTEVIRQDPNVNHAAGKEYGYVGITELAQSNKTAAMQSSAKINQGFNQNTYGSKTDFIINVGFNVSDIVFLGVNLGLQASGYSMYEILNERASDGSEGMFYNNFKRLDQTYSYYSSTVGIYGKFGIIVTPVAGLRVGATIQTPTRSSLSERWGYSMSNQYTTGKSSSGNTNGGKWQTILTSPMRFSFGLAYTFGKVAILSADYEMVDYKGMKYEAAIVGDEAYCQNLNSQISGETMQGGCLGASHLLRVGIEGKPISIIAVRAGYNLITGGERQYVDGTLKSLGNDTHQLSCGIGYDSPGSFFCDLAFRYSWKPSKTIGVYGDYGNRGVDETYAIVGGPTVVSDRALMGIVASVGWRF